MRVGLHRVMDPHPGQRGGQFGEPVPGQGRVQQQAGSGRLRRGQRLRQAASGGGFRGVPGQVRDGLARREPEPHPARQRPRQPHGAGQASGPDQERIQGLGSRARRQLRGHRVPNPGGQPAPPGQMAGSPAGRDRRLGPDTSVEADRLANSRQPGRGQQRPGGQVAGGKPGDRGRGADQLGQPGPGPPSPPPSLPSRRPATLTSPDARRQAPPEPGPCSRPPTPQP